MRPQPLVSVRVFNANDGRTQPRGFTTETAKNGPKLLAGTKLTIEECACMMYLGLAMLSWAPPAIHKSQGTCENHHDLVPT